MKESTTGKTTIIANGIVLTCDATNRCGRYSIAVVDGHIRDIVDRFDVLRKSYPDATVIDASNKLVVPGFINAHYHGASFLLRSMTDGIHASLWNAESRLDQVSDRLMHASCYDDVKHLYQAAYLAHLRSGTTCVGESPLPFDEVGFTRMLEGIEACGISAVVALQNWDQIRKAKEKKSARYAISLGREKEFTVYSFEQLTKAAKETNLPLYAHIAETQDDVQIIRENFQRDSMTLLNTFNALRHNTILVHANYVGEDEVKLIKTAGATVVVCPRSTAAKQTGYPSIRHLAKQGVRIALGTDWGSVDMLEEMRFFYQLPLVVPGLRMFSATEILRMATINGATTFGLGNDVGSVETGKRANITLLNVSDIRLPVLHPASPGEDWARLLVEHLTTADITDAMLDGVWKMHEGKFDGSPAKQSAEEYRTLHAKFFPPTSLSRTQQAQEHKEPQPNVFPFMSERTSTHQEAGGFETGVSPETKSTPILDITDRPADSAVPDHPKPPREPLKPELPKNTRRVFGEDEDF